MGQNRLVASPVQYSLVDGERSDRLAGTISFERKQKPAEKLNEWSCTIDNLMDLLNKATHCIQKEEMIHSLKV